MNIDEIKNTLKEYQAENGQKAVKNYQFWFCQIWFTMQKAEQVGTELCQGKKTGCKLLKLKFA